MEIIRTPITGDESVRRDSEPYSALVHFYRAFNRADMEVMSHNWANREDTVMVNPLGGIKRGWAEIQVVYQRIFNGPVKVYVEFHDYSIHEAADLSYSVGRERGYFQINDTRIELAIRTSRIFRRTADGWKQVHHHGSIDDPVLLNTYQAALNQLTDK